MKRFRSKLAILLILYAILISAPAGFSELAKSEIKVKNTSLLVERAQTIGERAQGLKKRDFLPENEGMLFEYSQDQILTFWMKETTVALSIAFLDANGIILEIQHMKSNSLKSHRSSQKVRYALEVNQGWFERNGIEVGDQVHL